MEQDLKVIKKLYGEAMSRFCRDVFPTLLEENQLLLTTLIENFEPNHSLYEDIVKNRLPSKFKEFIYKCAKPYEYKKEKIDCNKTPKELLSDVGYDLYECTTEEEIQSFKKYYAPREELCTFAGGRLKDCIVFFAVKKNVNEIKRKDFRKPERQDEYGTSVISIQFTKDSFHTLSIKNRYNHTVKNPDATFSNNLDNIVSGLTTSFEKYYGIVQKHINDDFEIPGYVVASDGKYYKYNYEIDNIYYCPNNIIIDNFEVNRFEKEKYVILDYFVLDLVNKKIKLYDSSLEESFCSTVTQIKNIEIKKINDEKEIRIIREVGKDVFIKIDKNNKMITLNNPNVKKINTWFLSHNTSLKELSMKNVKSIETGFLYDNQELTKLDLPNLVTIGTDFLAFNQELTVVDLPSLEDVCDGFIGGNSTIKEVNLPNLKNVGGYFLNSCEQLTKLDLPNLESVGNSFLENNKRIKEINLPNLIMVGQRFLYNNQKIKNLNLLKLKIADRDFMFKNNSVEVLNLPNLIAVKDNFLYMNNKVEILNLPKLEYAMYGFFYKNNSIRVIKLEKLKVISINFLGFNHKLEEIYMPNLFTKPYGFLYSSEYTIGSDRRGKRLKKN